MIPATHSFTNRRLALRTGMVSVIGALALCLPFSIAAGVDDTAFVTALQGSAKADGNKAISTFSKLRVGETVKVDAKGKITLVYIANGRREQWSEGAQFKVGPDKSQEIQGKPEVSEIPSSLARQLANTPDSSGGSSRVGMVRVRAADPMKMKEIDSKFAEFKATQLSGEHNAELYKLQALYNLKGGEGELKAYINELRTNNRSAEIQEITFRYMSMLTEGKK